MLMYSSYKKYYFNVDLSIKKLKILIRGSNNTLKWRNSIFLLHSHCAFYYIGVFMCIISRLLAPQKWHVSPVTQHLTLEMKSWARSVTHWNEGHVTHNFLLVSGPVTLSPCLACETCQWQWLLSHAQHLPAAGYMSKFPYHPASCLLCCFQLLGYVVGHERRMRVPKYFRQQRAQKKGFIV